MRPLLIALTLLVSVTAAQRTDVGALAGQVVDELGRGLSGATVTISLISRADKLDRTTVTNDAGQFEFRDLPAGRFAVVAFLPGHHSAEFGAPTPFDDGVPVRVEAAQRVSNVVIVLRSGAAITGRITDVRGRPCPGRVRALVGGWTAAKSAKGEVVETDSLGGYRLSNLPPGEYRLVAEPLAAELHVTDQSGADRVFVPARTFYPGVAAASGASPIVLRPGDDMTGIDIQVVLLPRTSLEVRVALPTGELAQQVQLALISADRTLIGSQYRSGSELPRIDSVVAGEYQLIVSGLEDPRGPRDLGWTTRRITIATVDPLSVSVTLEPGARIDGRALVDPNAALPLGDDQIQALWERFRSRTGGTRIGVAVGENLESPVVGFSRPVPVWLTPVGLNLPPGMMPLDGIFERFLSEPSRFGIRSIAPGSYVIQAGDVSAPPSLSLKSVTIGGREVLDLPVVLHAGENLTDVALTLTDRFADLSGIVTDADDKPRFDVTIVVFPSDARYWWRGTRRIRTTRPDTSGAYELHDLPSGAYLIATVPPSSKDDWNDPEVLGLLAITAMPVTIGDAEQKTQNVRIR